MSATRAIYLAGPEVFLPDAAEIGSRKLRICDRHGFQGLFPVDSEIGATAAQPPSGAIFEANLAMIRAADILVANLTPFRLVSADPGTVFELGYALARGSQVFGYTNLPAALRERVAQSARLARGGDGRLYADDGMAVEDFQLNDNLMLIEAIRSQGHAIIQPDKPPLDAWRDLATFEACIQYVAQVTRPA